MGLEPKLQIVVLMKSPQNHTSIFYKILFVFISGDRFEGAAGAVQHGGIAGLRAASHAASAASIPAPARP